MYGAFDVVLYFAIIQLFLVANKLTSYLSSHCSIQFIILFPIQCYINLSISLLFIYLFIYYIIFTQEYPISAQHCSPWGFMKCSLEIKIDYIYR